MGFIKQTKQNVNKSVYGFKDDVDSILGGFGDKKSIELKSDPSKTLKNSAALSSFIFILLVFNIFRKDIKGVVVFSIMFVISLCMFFGMYYSLLKKGYVDENNNVELSKKEKDEAVKAMQEHYKARKEKNKPTSSSSSSIKKELEQDSSFNDEDEDEF